MGSETSNSRADLEIILNTDNGFDPAVHQHTISANTINLAVGYDKPPYVMQESDSGYELELIRHIFSLMGYKARFVYVPFGRTQSMLSEHNIDGLLTVNARTINPAYLTESYITYQNSAISLNMPKFKVNRLSELSFFSVAAFQNSKKILGVDYAEAVSRTKYLEVPDQQRQVKLLLRNRFQVLIMDKNIFAYHQSNLEPNAKDKYQFNDLFPATQYSAAFKSQELINSFNWALEAFNASGERQKLAKKYGIILKK